MYLPLSFDQELQVISCDCGLNHALLQVFPLKPVQYAVTFSIPIGNTPLLRGRVLFQNSAGTVLTVLKRTISNDSAQWREVPLCFMLRLIIARG
jgi:hypothetical protein